MDPDDVFDADLRHLYNLADEILAIADRHRPATIHFDPMPRWGNEASYLR